MNDSKPWRNEKILQELYQERGLTHKEIAERLGCSQSTITVWCDKFGIEARDVHNTPASFYTIERGYECWASTVNNDEEGQQQEFVRVHRLLAVAEFGYDDVSKHVVHHKIPIPWLNTGENIELMTEENHGRKHAEESDVKRDSKGRWC